jgi:cytosine/adenosine deaminase-related metal-dependent hydrolase
LQLATLDGAVDLGIADRTGSITPGKRADLVLLRATDLNMAPVSDPVRGCRIVRLPANVDTVLIDGRILAPRGQVHGVRRREDRGRRRAKRRLRCVTKPSGRLDECLLFAGDAAAISLPGLISPAATTCA